jgi:vanillate O-demethylase ferredoxin subunit
MKRINAVGPRGAQARRSRGHLQLRARQRRRKRPLPAFSAGSHVDVQLPGGLTRPYSLCNDPTESHRYLIAVLRDPASRGGSRAMHDGGVEGELLQISPPKNHFALAHDARVAPAAGRRHRRHADPVHGRAAGAQYRAGLRDALLHTFAPGARRSTTASPAAPSRSSVQFHFDDGDSAQKLDLGAAARVRRGPVNLSTSAAPRASWTRC